MNQGPDPPYIDSEGDLTFESWKTDHGETLDENRVHFMRFLRK